MRRLALLALALAPSSEMAMAQPDETCMVGPIAILGWSARETGGYTELRLGVQNSGDQDVVMIDGVITFEDPLGNSVTTGPVEIDPDLVAPAGGAVIHSQFYRGQERLISVNHDLVRFEVCVSAVVLADGTVLRAD